MNPGRARRLRRVAEIPFAPPAIFHTLDGVPSCSPFLSAAASLPRSARALPAACLAFAGLLLLAGCHKKPFPGFPANYREYAYVTDGAAGTVTVLDLVDIRPDRTLQVGKQPTGLAVNPKRREVYAVNAGSDSVSVIDAATNQVVHTIGVHHKPFFISVDPAGERAYVANSGSNTVSVLDLAKRREIAVAGTGEGPGLARIAPDNRTLVVSNRVAGSISVYSVDASSTAPLHLRSTFAGCPGATDVAILPDATKAFVACSGSHQVMAVWLAAAPDSWRGRQDATLQHDHLLAMLDVGQTPLHLALKPDGGEAFSTNFGSNSLSEISTWTNEVENTYPGVMQPSRGLVSKDDSTLWISDFGSDSVSLYSIDDGRIEASVRVGSHPDALALSANEHILLAADSGSADIAVIRTGGSGGPTLFTLLPAGPQPNDIVTLAYTVR